MKKNNRYLANSFLFLTFITYIIATYFKNQYNWLGYVIAFAEAGMIGGIADWFAVTALFKHPLGLKIPHTAIIPNSKDKIGKNISNFIRENFLSESYLRENIEKYPVSEKMGIFLLEQKKSVNNLVVNVIKEVLKTFSLEQVQNYLYSLLLNKYKDIDVKNIIIKVLTDTKNSEKHFQLINFVLLTLADWLKDPENNKKVTEWIKNAIKHDAKGKTTFFGAIKSFFVGEPDLRLNVIDFHTYLNSQNGRELRVQINGYCDEFLHYLKTDKEIELKLEELKESIWKNIEPDEYINNMVQQLKIMVELDLDSENSKIRKEIDSIIELLSKKLTEDEKIKRYIKKRLLFYVPGFIIKNGVKIDAFFMNYIEKLNVKEVSDMIENKVGDDLQYIRINGTIVGGIIGLTIYSVTQFIERIF
ncbi:TPA: DUF445 domain-containing protein [Escherichia coli]|nr:DUF445 domain-containing protein [Escherichia coli]